MSTAADFLNTIQMSILLTWKKLTNLQRAISLGSIAGGILVLSIFLTTRNRTEYQYLFMDISQEDVHAISDYLKKNNVNDYVIDAKGVKVPTENVDRVRLMLSAEGLPSNGVVGWESFDKENFTKTEFEQQVQKLRAIQGELSRTIGAIDGILTARVHIVQPKSTLFLNDVKKTTAAIYIKTKRGFTLEKKQIKGIQHLVSRSVEGLTLNDITIIDGEGQMLTEVESENSSSQQSRELMSYKRNIEKMMEERIRAIVGKIVGPDRIEARVDVGVDFTEEKQMITDVNPDNSAIVHKSTQGFSMEGEGLTPTGIPGAKSNVPGENEKVTGSSSKSGSKKDTEFINYEVSKTVSEKTLPVGNITRITVSAIVDGKQVYPVDGTTPDFSARTPEEIKKIEELIKNAVGFKEGRDSLSVQNMMFQMDPVQQQEISQQKQETRTYLSTLALSGSIALALLLFFAFVVRPYFRWLSYDPEKKASQHIAEEYKPDLESTIAKKVQVQEEVSFDKLSPKEQVLFLARNEPKRTTEAIRMLMNPSQMSG